MGPTALRNPTAVGIGEVEKLARAVDIAADRRCDVVADTAVEEGRVEGEQEEDRPFHLEGGMQISTLDPIQYVRSQLK